MKSLVSQLFSRYPLVSSHTTPTTHLSVHAIYKSNHLQQWWILKLVTQRRNMIIASCVSFRFYHPWNQHSPWKLMVETTYFPFGKAHFQGRTVSFREGTFNQKKTSRSSVGVSVSQEFAPHLGCCKQLIWWLAEPIPRDSLDLWIVMKRYKVGPGSSYNWGYTYNPYKWPKING